MSVNLPRNEDYMRFNLPALMARDVKKLSPDSGLWVRDESWYAEIREKYRSLFNFFRENSLVCNDQLPANFDVEEVVLFNSAFTEAGRALLDSGSVDRWIRSFDKPGSNKRFSDISKLELALKKIVGELPRSR